MKVTSPTNSFALVLREENESGIIAVILIEAGQEVDITEKIEQAISDHYSAHSARISEKLPDTKQYPKFKRGEVIENDFRPFAFDVELFEDEDSEYSELRTIIGEITVVYSNKAYDFQ